jgi:predicted nuclease with TOPRIM domain
LYVGERDEAKAVLEETQKQLEETSAQMDAAVAQAEHAREQLRRGDREKEKVSELWNRAHAEIIRLRDELYEERNARAALEEAVSAFSQAAHRQARLRQVLAMGELLSAGDSDANISITTTTGENSRVLDSEPSYE